MQVITHQDRNNESGSALLTILIAGFIIAGVGAAAFMIFTGGMNRNKNSVKRSQTLAITDGAAYQALAMIAEDPDRVDSPPSNITSGSLGGGTYELSMERRDDNIVFMQVKGKLDGHSENLKVYFRPPFSAKAFTKTVFSNGSISGSGNGTLNCGSSGTHSNKNTDYKGSVEIIGDAQSVGTTSIKGSSSVSGDTISGTDEITFPPLDLDHYYQTAADNDEVYEPGGGKKKITGGTYEPAGGIMWVVGDVKISSHTTINGSLFVTGDIDASGHFEINQDTDQPAMVSRDGGIKLSGQGSIDGMVYAGSGDIKISGGKQHSGYNIAGVLVAWNDVSVSGRWGVIETREQDPKLEGDDYVEIIIWEY